MSEINKVYIFKGATRAQGNHIKLAVAMAEIWEQLEMGITQETMERLSEETKGLFEEQEIDNPAPEQEDEESV